MAQPQTTQSPVHASTYSLEFDRVFALGPGLLAPVYSMLTIPGDSLGLRTVAAIDTLPAATPAYARFRAQLRYFWTDIRAYLPTLSADIVSVNPQSISLPVAPPPYVIYPPSGSGSTSFNGDILKSSVRPNSLYNFLYAPVGSVIPLSNEGSPTSEAITRYFTTRASGRLQSLFPFMTYIHTYYKYYMNPQEPQLRYSVVSTGNSLRTETVTAKSLASLLENALRGYHYASLDGTPSATAAVHFKRSTTPYAIGSLSPLYEAGFGVENGGLAILPYLPSVNECWISSSAVSSISAATSLSTSPSIDELLAKDKLRRYLSLGFFGAAGYRDWVKAQFAVTPIKGLCNPQYLGGTEFLVSFSDVLGTASDNLGERGGQGAGSGSGSYRRYAFDSYGIFQVMFDIRPILNYSQGIDEQFTFQKLSDLPSYEMSSIPWEPLRRRTLSCVALNRGQSAPGYVSGTSVTNDAAIESLDFFNRTVIGYRVAWTPYRSAFNRAIGHFEFGQNLDSWTLNRKYIYAADSSNITDTSDFSTYTNPAGSNEVFVDQSPLAPNFMVYIRFNMDLRRPLTSNAVPSF